jgi:TRAP-type C4-dicarboxylate transport system permease large subunit
MDEGMSSLILLAVPLFILLGHLVEMTGMAKAMVDFLASLLGHVRGGLNYVLLGAMLLVSGISGAKTADMAAVAPVLLPEMKKRGNDEGELISLLAASGAMAETIPPSLVLITIGSVAGISIGALFTGGILPGVVLALLLAVLARYRSAEVAQGRSARRWRRRPHAAGGAAGAAAAGADPHRRRRRRGHRHRGVDHRHRLRRGRRPPDLPALRLGPHLSDAGGHGGAVRRHPVHHRHRHRHVLGADAIGLLAQPGDLMTSVPGGKYGFLLVSIAAFIVLGSVLEGIPAMVLFAPLLFPVAKAIGVHEVHYAMVVILAMGIGLFAPPFGLGYYAACTIGRVHPDVALRRIWPYLGACCFGLLVVAFVPWFSIGLLG